MTSTETQYVYTERESISILHGLKNQSLLLCLWGQCNNKSQATGNNFKKDIANLSHRLQGILLCIHQYKIRVLYKPGSQPFIADWLSRHNHETNRDEEVLGMCITINSCMNILGCMEAEETMVAILDVEHLGLVSKHAVCS